MNLYAYVGNSPVVLIDPLGYSEIWKLDPGSCPGSLTPPAVPPGADVAENAAKAGEKGVVFWIDQVKPEGEWDYKLLEPKGAYERFGNYNYGYTGAQFFSDTSLHRAAGLVGWLGGVKGEGKPWGNPPYGDQIIDYLYIQEGIVDYKIENRCPKGSK